MTNLEIDIETFSDVDLQKCGVYRYTQSPNFEILLFGYSVDGGEVQVVDIARGEKLPMDIITVLTDDTVTKWAFNAAFERVCLSVWLQRNYPQHFNSYNINEDTVGDYLDPAAWKCSMIWSAYMGLPLSLAGAGIVLGLEEQKLKEGKDLIRYFCVPCKPTKVNGGRTRNLPEHDMEKWNLFKFYNKRDVEVEMSIQDRLKKYPVPDFVWEEYHLDQEINDRGIALDMEVVENAIAFDAKSKAELAERMQKLTDLDNPNSVVQMKQWLADNGLEMDSLGKKEVAQAVKTAPKELAEVLLLRQQLSKSSVKKYQAIIAPIDIAGERLGTLFMYKSDEQYDIDDIILCEYGTTVVGLEMMRSVNEENAEETRKVQIVKSAISTLSFSELEAITHIFEELDGNEGILVASKIADRVGITRSVIVNALRKFESAGVIESRSSGMKGTYIKVLNDVVFDELKALKAVNTK